MNTITFDTLKFAQTLEDAGVDQGQATAIAQAVRDSHDAAELATKSDIRELRAVTTSDLREFKAEMKLEMRELEMRLMLKLGSLMVVLMGLMLAVLKL